MRQYFSISHGVPQCFFPHSPVRISPLTVSFPFYPKDFGFYEKPRKLPNHSQIIFWLLSLPPLSINRLVCIVKRLVSFDLFVFVPPHFIGFRESLDSTFWTKSYCLRMRGDLPNPYSLPLQALHYSTRVSP